MPNKRSSGETGKQPGRILVSKAFEGDEAPGALSVGIVSLVELCQLAMPDPAKLRERLTQAGFKPGPQERADEAGRMLALDAKLIDAKVRNVKHELHMRGRHDLPVLILLSTADSNDGKLVFVSTLFHGAIEADAVKAAAHVTKDQPAIGSRVTNADGSIVRRVFWDTKGASGIRALVVSGPDDVEALDQPRAITAFNKVAAKR